MKTNLLATATILCLFFSTSHYAADREKSHKSHGKHCEPKVIYQKDIPFTATQPGIYRLGQSVTYDGANAAITLAGNNIKLLLDTSTITLTNCQAVGIMINNPQKTISEITVESDSISHAHSKKACSKGIMAIFVNNANYVTIKKVSTINNFNGIHIVNSNNVQVLDSQFNNAINGGAYVFSCTNVKFNNCVFNDNGYGILFDAEDQDCSVTNCEFPNSILTNLLAYEVYGLMIDRCSFTNTGDTNQASLVQLGGPAATQLCTNAIMKNCTLVNGAFSNTALEGVVVAHGSNILIDSCCINNNNAGQNINTDLAGIHISNPAIGPKGVVASGVLVKNCVITGPAINGIHVDSGSANCLIENCLVAGAFKDGILLDNTTATTVQNNTVNSNSVNGIALGKGSASNAILNNVVNSNTQSGIFLQGAVTGFPATNHNLIQNNQVLSNNGIGINNKGSSLNQIYNNTAFNNGTGGSQNYFPTPFFPTGPVVVSNPGDPTATAANIAGAA